jgi:hypothetical protein
MNIIEESMELHAMKTGLKELMERHVNDDFLGSS